MDGSSNGYTNWDPKSTPNWDSAVDGHTDQNYALMRLDKNHVTWGITKNSRRWIAVLICSRGNGGSPGNGGSGR